MILTTYSVRAKTEVYSTTLRTSRGFQALANISVTSFGRNPLYVLFQASFHFFVIFFFISAKKIM